MSLTVEQELEHAWNEIERLSAENAQLRKLTEVGRPVPSVYTMTDLETLIMKEVKRLLKVKRGLDAGETRRLAGRPPAGTENMTESELLDHARQSVTRSLLKHKTALGEIKSGRDKGVYKNRRIKEAGGGQADLLRETGWDADHSDE